MIIVPTSGQLQVPGSLQSFARVKLTIGANTTVTRNFTAAGEPEMLTPDAGYVAWKYLFQGVRRYGQRLPIHFEEQYIFTDIPNLEIEHLLVVLRFDLTASISIRRTAV